MRRSAAASERRADTEPRLPPYWTAQSTPGGIALRYAVRGGIAHALLTALGGAIVLWCLYAAGWLMASWFGPGGEVLVGGVIAVLVLLGGVTFGVYILDRMLYVAETYRMETDRLAYGRRSLFGVRTETAYKSDIVEIFQHYTPPGASAPQSSSGTWVTFVRYRAAGGRKTGELPLTGLHSPDEARWLGPLLSQWAGVPLKRDYAAGLEEADPALLPKL